MIEFVINYLNDNGGDSIKEIDNPCNCELLKEIFQKEVITKIQLVVPVNVNGVSEHEYK